MTLRKPILRERRSRRTRSSIASGVAPKPANHDSPANEFDPLKLRSHYVTDMQDFTAHFPRTHYDTMVSLASRAQMVKWVRDDLANMNAAGIQGAVGGPTFDHFSGYDLYLESIKKKIQSDAMRSHLATFGRPIDAKQLDALFAGHPDWFKIARTSFLEYASLLNFEKLGKKVFYFARPLVERLAETMLDAPSDYLRLPFGSCMFVVHSPVALDALYCLGGNTPPNRTAPITVFLNELPLHGMREITIVAFHSDGDNTYKLVKREILINPKWSIERSLKTDWNALHRENPAWEINDTGYKGDLEDDSEFFKDGLHFFRIIINAVLYLASSDPDLSLRTSPAADLVAQAKTILNGYKRHALNREAQHYSRLDGTVAGENLHPIEVSGSTSTRAPSLGATGMQLDRRFVVRGHWKNQAHGEGMQLRKLIWIKPYWKGPEMAEIINKPYKVR